MHVGLPKSGTSYLQAVFAENKDRLRERSRVLYPGATWSDQVLATRDLLNANPHGARESTVHLDLPALGLDWDDVVQVTDAVTGAVYEWGAHNYVRLDPFAEPAHIFSLTRSRS